MRHTKVPCPFQGGTGATRGDPPRASRTASVRAVIFDVDGVLVRSMDRNHEAYQKVFEPLGIRIPRREVFANEGRRSRELIDFLAKARGLELSDAQLDRMTRDHQATFASFGPMPFYPGVKKLLRVLRGRGHRLAMVTSNWRSNVNRNFGDLTELFEVIVSAEDVTRAKPDPEPYIKALDGLGASPNDAVVIENAPPGIRAARAAGIRVIAVTSTNPAKALSEADAIVPTVADVARALERFE